MTFTEKTMEWLNQNRNRSYPMETYQWRKKVSPESGLDCIVLDATVFDPDSYDSASLVVEGLDVVSDMTTIHMLYRSIGFDVELRGGDLSGEGSFESRRIALNGGWLRPASISISMSSHAYIIDRIGTGSWMLKCPVLDSRVIRMTHGVGVDRIQYNGSEGVEGRSSEGHASGDVILEDGYRTSPIIHRGKILVRVGKKYGYDPCMYDYGEDGAVDCKSPMFFFCGQNAVNGGNVILKGGKGIAVTQGRSYHVKTGSCAGKDIPCIEIVAGRELLNIYRPSNGES